jgi:hypothetical protein
MAALRSTALVSLLCLGSPAPLCALSSPCLFLCECVFAGSLLLPRAPLRLSVRLSPQPLAAALPAGWQRPTGPQPLPVEETAGHRWDAKRKGTRSGGHHQLHPVLSDISLILSLVQVARWSPRRPRPRSREKPLGQSQRANDNTTASK